MKPGMLLSVLFTLAVAVGVVLFYILSQGVPDSATPATTAPGALAKAQLPADLPAMFESRDAKADAAPHYLKAIDHYKRYRFKLTGDEVDSKAVEPLIDSLLAGMKADRVNPHFLDDAISSETSGALDLSLQTHRTALAALKHAETLEDKAQALLICRAVWAFGQRIFENNVIFELREAGRANFKSAANTLIKRLDPDNEQDSEWWDRIDAWGEAESHYDQQIQRMFQLVRRSDNVQIGDVINVAIYHADPAFRIMAVQRLAELKFDPKTPANLKAIQGAVTKAKSDPDAYVVQAAHGAQRFTREDLQSAH